MTMVMPKTGEGGRAGRKLTTIAAKWDAWGRKEASGLFTCGITQPTTLAMAHSHPRTTVILLQANIPKTSQ